VKISAAQLAANLTRDASPPWYLVSGDDPLLVQEACDLVRDSARRRGYGERLVFDVERGFDWGSFLHEGRGLSLFAQRRLMELRLATNRPGDNGARALQEYASNPPPDVVLLVVMPKLDGAVQKTNWYRLLEHGGVVVQVWPVDSAQLPKWIMRRMRENGMAPTTEAAELLAERVEGNLLACAQEIEKMRLLYGDRAVHAQQVLDAVGDSARFDVFALVDSALAGDGARCARILSGLRAEGVEPAVIVWALGREVRSMAAMAFAARGGVRVEQVMGRFRVWEKRKAIVRAGLKRHDAGDWWAMLRQVALIDRAVKGTRSGNVWDEMLQLALKIAGIELFERA